MKRMVDSELINSLGNDIKFDGMGNVTVGRNLEVGGNVFTLNGKQWGIMPVCLKINNSITNKGYIIYSEKPKIFSPSTNITVFKCRGIYLGESGNVYIFSYSPSATDISIENDTLYIKSNDAYTSFINSAFNMELAENEVSQIKNKQNKLYKHKIMINELYMLTYNSTRDLEANSIVNLRTIMKISSEGDQEILPVCASDATAIAALVVTTDLCQVDGADVTHISDTVTPL